MIITSENLKLKKSIQIFYPINSGGKNPRIRLSSGTFQKIELEDDKVKYRSGAFLPKEPWRQTNTTEYNLLFSNEAMSKPKTWDIGSHIAIVRIPEYALLPLGKFNFRSIETVEEYQSIVSNLEGEKAIKEVLNRLSDYILNPQNLEILGIQVTEPNLKTVTVNYYGNSNEKLFVGMHLDSWDKAPLRRRHKSRNRICINLGQEDRFFLFINLTLMDMFRHLGLSETEDIHKHYRGTEIGYEFMLRYPSYPVVQLRVAPGEAYIAPTDNIIHDASTIGNHYPDITLTFLGYFGI